MAIELLEALATDLLEYEDLVGLGVVFEDGGFHHCAFNIGSSDGDGLSVCDEEYLGELYISTFGVGEPLHKDFVASFYFKLLACNVYDCVHQTMFLNVWAWGGCPAAALVEPFGHKMDGKDSNKSLIYKFFFDSFPSLSLIGLR